MKEASLACIEEIWRSFYILFEANIVQKYTNLYARIGLNAKNVSIHMENMVHILMDQCVTRMFIALDDDFLT